MAEFAMYLIKLFVQFLKGLIFLAQLGPRTMDAISRRSWSKAERIDNGTYEGSRSVQLAFDTHGNTMAVSNHHYSVWARHFTPIKGWGNSELIDHGRNMDDSFKKTRGSVSDLTISCDTQGNYLAVWCLNTGYNDVHGFIYETWSNHYTSGQGWGKAEIFDHGPSETSLVKIARDLQGNALAVWAHFSINCTTLWAKKYKPDTGWSNPNPIANISGDAKIMQLTFDTKGNALLLWHTKKEGKKTSGLFSVYIMYYSFTTGWDKAEIFSKVLNSYHMDTLKFAFDSVGNTIVVSSFKDSTDNENQVHIWAKRYDILTGWEKAIKIDPGINTSYSAYIGESESVQPQISFDSRDHAIVVWKQNRRNAQGGIWTNCYIPGKGWGKASAITTSDNEQSNHQLAVDPRGNAIAIWEQRNGLSASYHTADAGWSTPEHIYHYSGDEYKSLYPKIAFDPAGNAIAIWHQVFFYTTIWSLQYTPGKGWGKKISVNRDYSNTADQPLIFIDSAGLVHVAWEQQDNDSNNRHYWTSYLLESRRKGTDNQTLAPSKKTTA